MGSYKINLEISIALLYAKDRIKIKSGKEHFASQPQIVQNILGVILMKQWNICMTKTSSLAIKKSKKVSNNG